MKREITDTITLHQGDCIRVMQALPENSVDSVVTDPPYELGFMGKKWDASGIAFDSGTWGEALRVLKPGGHMLAFGGTRTFHRMACAIEDAGFEIRDTIMWVYGSGFPKSKNLDGDWQGWGTALKPAWEPIILARKPLAGTVAANVQAWGTGALNIDGCRVPHQTVSGGNLADNPHLRGTKLRAAPVATTFGNAGDETPLTSALGRWPANVIHDGSDEVMAAFPQTASGTGAIKRASSVDGHGNSGAAYGAESRAAGTPMICYGDAGSAARFFYCAKASRTDRNEGCEHMERKPLHWSSGDQSPGTFQAAGTDKTSQNNHPTVKPTDLMAYLCRLVTPPGGLVLDPFMGSGSSGRGAVLEGLDFIGIEQDGHFVDIAEARIRAALNRSQQEADQESAQGDLFAQGPDANFERGQNTFQPPAATMDTCTTEAGVL